MPLLLPTMAASQATAAVVAGGGLLAAQFAALRERQTAAEAAAASERATAAAAAAALAAAHAPWRHPVIVSALNHASIVSVVVFGSMILKDIVFIAVRRAALQFGMHYIL